MLRRVLVAVLLAAIGAGSVAYVRGDDHDSEAAQVAKGRPPVVLLIFDEFPTDLLLGPDGKIDAGRYPAFARLASDGYWFPNATSTYDSTTKAVPQIIDGRLPRPGGAATFADHPRSVYDLFGPRGYEIERVEAATSICPPRYCPGAKRKRPGILEQLQSGRRARLARFLGSIGRRDEPTFWLGHVLLPHGPHLFLPSGKQTRASWPDPIPGMNSTPGFYSKYLALHTQQRLQLQIGFLDRQLGRLIRRMRADGSYDRALIAIAADHGISSEWNVPTRRNADKANIDELAPVPMIFKAPGQRDGRTVHSYVRTTDVLPTIADLLHVRVPYAIDGHSAFSRTVRRRRTVMMIKRDFSRRVRISAGALERRRAALLKRRLRNFGSGDWGDRFYTGIGPHRELIGQRVAGVAQAARGALKARLVGRSAIASVRARSAVLPTEIAGTVDSGPGDQTRDLAVAVNGRIEAVGRSFHLKVDPGERGRGGESFAVMVPERSLHPGHNVVEVFEIVDDGQLRPLGRS